MHTHELCSKLNKTCYAFRNIKKYFNLEILKTLYHANFETLLRYGIIFWGASKDVETIFKVQKRILRIMLNMKSRQSCRNLFKHNNLLTVAGLYIYECLLYIKKNPLCFQTVEFTHAYGTRHKHNYKFPVHRLTLTEKCPYYNSIKFYNILPNRLKVENFRVFKKTIYNYICIIEPYTITEFCKFNHNMPMIR